MESKNSVIDTLHWYSINNYMIMCNSDRFINRKFRLKISSFIRSKKLSIRTIN